MLAQPTAALIALFTLTSGRGANAQAQWHLTPEQVFGATDGGPAELEDVRGFVVDAKGEVMVIDYKTQNLRIFAADGRLVRTIGREGAGPGEFNTPNGIQPGPDHTYWINDPGNGRYSVHAADGHFLRAEPSHETGYGFVWDGWFDNQGRLVTTAFGRSSHAVGLDYRATMLMVRRAADGRADTLDFPRCTPPALRAHPRVYDWPLKQGSVTSVPFQPRQGTAYDAAGFVWCENGSEYAVYKLGLERHDTLLTIRGHAASLPVTTAEREQAVETARAWVRKISTEVDAIHPGDIPALKPVLAGLSRDEQGRLWVELTSPDSLTSHYDVYGPNGRAIASVVIPAAPFSLPLVVHRDRVYLLTKNADDVPVIVRYRIGSSR